MAQRHEENGMWPAEGVLSFPENCWHFGVKIVGFWCVLSRILMLQTLLKKRITAQK